MTSSDGGWSDGGLEADTGRVPPAFAEGARYRIDGTLGHGGMGEVYLAWDGWLERHVALKCVHGRHSSPLLRERLLREARLTGRLEHPSILPVLDAGELDDGRLFYTMRRVRGSTLEAELPTLQPGERLRHVLAVVRAIAYAHANGVIHRDLKPSNVMIGALGETYVVDWGLARRVDATDDAALDLSTLSGPDLTTAGSVVGTRRYLAPEGLNGHTDCGTDVYALGACLVEVVTGERGDDAAHWHQLLDLIPDPVLRAIASKALAPHPEDRYSDARALLADLDAYVDNLPVGAYEYSVMESLRRLVHTYRWPLAVGTTAVVAVALTAIVAGVQVVGERDRAVRAEALAQAARRVADSELADSLVLQAVAAAEELVMSDAELAAVRALAIRDDPVARGVLMGTASLVPRFVDADVAACDGRWVSGTAASACVNGVEDAQHVEPMEDGSYWVFDRYAARLHGADGAVKNEVMSHGYRYDALGSVVMRSQRHDISIADTTGRTQYATPCDGHMIDGARLSPDGAWVVCDDDRFAFIPHEGEERHIRVAGSKRYHRGGSVSGNVFLAARDAVIDAIDLANGAVLNTLLPDAGLIRRVDACDGWTLVDGADTSPTLLGNDDPRPWWRASRAWQGTRLLPTGMLVTASDPNWTLALDDGLRSRTMFAEGISSAVLSNDGSRVAVARGGGRIAVVDVASMRVVWDVTLGASVVAKSVAFSPDGRRLFASAAGRHDVVTFDAATGDMVAKDGDIETGCRRLVALEAGWRCVNTGGLHLRIQEEPGHRFDFRLDDLTASGTQVAVGIKDTGEVVRLDEDIRVIPGTRASGRIGVSRTGEVMAWDSDTGLQLHIDGEDARALSGGPERVLDIAVSPDGRWVAASGFDDVMVWSTDDARLVAHLPDLHEERVATVVFSDTHLFTAGWDGQLRRWSLAALTDTPTPDDVRHRWRMPAPE